MICRQESVYANGECTAELTVRWDRSREVGEDPCLVVFG